jgi:hypothetical protein
MSKTEIGQVWSHDGDQVQILYNEMPAGLGATRDVVWIKNVEGDANARYVYVDELVEVP